MGGPRTTHPHTWSMYTRKQLTHISHTLTIQHTSYIVYVLNMFLRPEGFDSIFSRFSDRSMNWSVKNELVTSHNCVCVCIFKQDGWAALSGSSRQPKCMTSVGMIWVYYMHSHPNGTHFRKRSRCGNPHVAVNDLYLSVRQCEWFGQVGTLGVELEKRSEVTTPHSIIQPARICFFSAHYIATLSILCHNVLLSGIPGC